MKNLVLASLLGSAATAFAVPALSGPVHFAITRPFSLFGWIPAGPTAGSVTVTLGAAPLDFVMTDIMVGNYFQRVIVTVNGNPVFNCGRSTTGWTEGNVHMTSGLFIAAGSTIAVEASGGNSPNQEPVTIAGYVQ
jgi:hypothetical protein